MIIRRKTRATARSISWGQRDATVTCSCRVRRLRRSSPSWRRSSKRTSRAKETHEMPKATFKIWRGNGPSGELKEYTTEITEGMVVLDAVHQIQAEQANDLAVRWNCKAGKCGSCSAEVNGSPKLMCMTRLSELPLDKPVSVEPMRAFPPIKDLVTDVSWNFAVK